MPLHNYAPISAEIYGKSCTFKIHFSITHGKCNQKGLVTGYLGGGGEGAFKNVNTSKMIL